MLGQARNEADGLGQPPRSPLCTLEMAHAQIRLKHEALQLPAGFISVVAVDFKLTDHLKSLHLSRDKGVKDQQKPVSCKKIPLPGT